MRPFVEAGVGKGTAGGAASHRKAQADVRDYDQHSTFEVNVDGAVPRGISIGQKAARAGSSRSRVV